MGQLHVSFACFICHYWSDWVDKHRQFCLLLKLCSRASKAKQLFYYFLHVNFDDETNYRQKISGISIARNHTLLIEVWTEVIKQFNLKLFEREKEETFLQRSWLVVWKVSGSLRTAVGSLVLEWRKWRSNCVRQRSHLTWTWIQMMHLRKPMQVNGPIISVFVVVFIFCGFFLRFFVVCGVFVVAFTDPLPCKFHKSIPMTWNTTTHMNVEWE